MTIQEAKKAIGEWAANEHGYDFDEVAAQGEPDTAIAIAYSDYEGRDDGLFVTEQWYADCVHLTYWCELNDKRVDALEEKFSSLEYLVSSLDFGWLIGEADEFIEEHRAMFEEV